MYNSVIRGVSFKKAKPIWRVYAHDFQVYTSTRIHKILQSKRLWVYEYILSNSARTRKMRFIKSVLWIPISTTFMNSNNPISMYSEYMLLLDCHVLQAYTQIKLAIHKRVYPWDTLSTRCKACNVYSSKYSCPYYGHVYGIVTSSYVYFTSKNIVNNTDWIWVYRVYFGGALTRLLIFEHYLTMRSFSYYVNNFWLSHTYHSRTYFSSVVRLITKLFSKFQKVQKSQKISKISKNFKNL